MSINMRICICRPTDHATPSVTIGHIYVHSTAMRPNNNNNNNLIYNAYNVKNIELGALIECDMMECSMIKLLCTKTNAVRVNG